jgi:hypothetical protein
MATNPTKTDRLCRKPDTFRRLTGISPEDFDRVLEELRPLYEEAEQKRLDRPDRERAIGGGRNFKLPLEDRFLMLLMYYRLYITHEFLGFLFDLDDSNVGRNINPLEPLLAQIFRVERRRIDVEEKEIEKLFFDGTEQPIQRPSTKGPRREYYSGKQGEHTIKHQIAVDQDGKIQAVSPSYPGRVHDKRVYDHEQVVIPRKAEPVGDLGYQGSVLTVPNKTPKGGTLSEQEKAYNREHASERILVEHVIGKLKIFKILSDQFRNELSRHTLMFKNIAGLCNLRFSS